MGQDDTTFLVVKKSRLRFLTRTGVGQFSMSARLFASNPDTPDSVSIILEDYTVRMSHVWAVGSVVFGCLISELIGVNFVSAHPQLPQSLEAKTCASSAPPDELPNARFIRKGGRITRNVKVWRQGSALMIDDVAQGRDLTQYERLELADPEPRVVSDQRRNPVLAQARTFLWRHWQDRKRAYLLLTLSSVDATSTSHVFVEPDETGRWRLYWRGVRHTNEVDDSPTDYSVEWVIPGDWNKPGTPLPRGQEPDPLKNKLEFRDGCGEVDESF
jgi:hypothetical protein